MFNGSLWIYDWGSLCNKLWFGACIDKSFPVTDCKIYLFLNQQKEYITKKRGHKWVPKTNFSIEIKPHIICLEYITKMFGINYMLDRLIIIEVWATN